MTASKSVKKPTALSGPQQVQAYLDRLEHPLKPAMLEVRNLILSANPGITEQIKWNAPSFCYENEDRITFNLHGTGRFRLIFHCGAKVRAHAGQARLIEDTTGLLEWASNDRAIVTLTSPEDVQAKKEQLLDVITKWIEAK